MCNNLGQRQLNCRTRRKKHTDSNDFTKNHLRWRKEVCLGSGSLQWKNHTLEKTGSLLPCPPVQSRTEGKSNFSSFNRHVRHLRTRRFRRWNKEVKNVLKHTAERFWLLSACFLCVVFPCHWLLVWNEEQLELHHGLVLVWTDVQRRSWSIQMLLWWSNGKGRPHSRLTVTHLL